MDEVREKREEGREGGGQYITCFSDWKRRNDSRPGKILNSSVTNSQRNENVWKFKYLEK